MELMLSTEYAVFLFKMKTKGFYDLLAKLLDVEEFKDFLKS